MDDDALVSKLATDLDRGFEALVLAHQDRLYSIALRLLVMLTEQGGVVATRALAVSFLLCDMAISASLVLLLIIREPRAPAWLERRSPASGRWLWRVLMGLTILCYASLAPTFLFLLIQKK